MVPGVLESVGLLPEDLPPGGWTLAEGPQPEGNLHFGRQAACPQLCLDELGRHGGRLVEHGGCDGRAAGRCHGALLQQSLLGTHCTVPLQGLSQSGLNRQTSRESPSNVATLALNSTTVCLVRRLRSGEG